MGKKPDKIYKYESVNTYSLQNLKNAQIYFNKPAAFNDPYECLLTLPEQRITDENISFYCKHKLLPKYEHLVNEPGGREKLKDVLFRSLDIVIKEFITKARESQGCCCFSETNKEILMWSHYANSHQGFCLEFDTSVPPFNSIEEVKYFEEIPSVDFEKLYSDDESVKRQETKKAMFAKYEKWGYEKEWRIYHQVSNKLFGYPIEALTGVYFGAKMECAFKEIICLIIQGQSSHTKFYEAQLSESRYSMTMKEFTYTSFKEAGSKQ